MDCKDREFFFVCFCAQNKWMIEQGFIKIMVEKVQQGELSFHKEVILLYLLSLRIIYY